MLEVFVKIDSKGAEVGIKASNERINSVELSMAILELELLKRRLLSEAERQRCPKAVDDMKP